MALENSKYIEAESARDSKFEALENLSVNPAEHEDIPEIETSPTPEIPADAKPLVHSDEGEREVTVPEEPEEFHEMTPDQVLKSPNAIVLEKILDHELNMDEAYVDQEEILNFSQQ